jgi:REP element-mobilizing transposase RayT
MTKSNSQVWVHAVWSTKNRMRLIDSSFETQLYKFISKQFYELGCIPKIVNGAQDHIHCLFLMNKTKSIADIIKHVKGSSSFFINQSNFIGEYFIWQRGYAAFAISERDLDKIYNYIKNQKDHHRLVCDK